MERVFFESTASTDVLVDKEGNPLDIDSGAAPFVPKTKTFRLSPSSQTVGGSSLLNMIWNMSWFEYDGDAPAEVTSSGGGTDNAIAISEGGVWLIDFTILAQSQDSGTTYDRFEVILGINNPAENLHAGAVGVGAGDDPNVDPFIASTNISVARLMQTGGGIIVPAVRMSGTWQIKGPVSGSGNYYGTSLAVTQLTPE